jgi:predicted AAA+ superfamily ATPase
MPPSSLAFRQPLTELLASSLSGPLPPYTPRHVYGPIHLPGKATAVVGMRRAGKTTFLHQLRAERFGGGMPRHCLPYINFEDERLVGLQATDLQILLDEYYRQYPELQHQETVTWCFDEIQVVAGWERFIRRMLDSERVDLFVSGSSSALLSRELATSMRGRGWEVIMHPFSFGEALQHREYPMPERADFLSASQRSALEHAFLEYLTVGGFPEVQTLPIDTRHRVLRDYVEVAMFRDVVERHGVTNVTGLHWLVRHMLGNAAALFSVEKFYAALKSQGFSISKDTVHALVAHLDDCFLIRTVGIETDSERRRMANPRKAYPVDPGLIPVYDRTGRTNIGHALETIILLELERRGLTVSYVKTPQGREVDFLARTASGQAELIQVCADATDPTTHDREVRALVEARAMFPEARCRLLTLTRDAIPPDVPNGIMAEPAYQWLLRTV